MSRYRSLVLLLVLVIAPGVVTAGDEPKPENPDRAAAARDKPDGGAAEAEPAGGGAEAKAEKKEGPKELSGMSILGNQEAPKSLVIVPWKSSSIGKAVGISTMLDDSRQPVDREVFMRELSYYEIRHAGGGSAPGEAEGTGPK